MDPASLLEMLRTIRQPVASWGLAWYLASELCARFYCSHGIAPWVITHEGLGYYGITLNKVPCRVHKQADDPIGRLTMGGDVENWASGSAGGHGCELIQRFQRGEPLGDLVQACISHLRLPPRPAVSHARCRHKRWGASYVVLFQVAATIALRHEPEEIGIYNNPIHTQRLIDQLDPQAGLAEHPGMFMFSRGERKVCVAGDGRYLDGTGENMWEDYMSGITPLELSEGLLRRIYG